MVAQPADPAGRDLLAGVTVLEAGGSLRIAYAGRLLADLGADVVKPTPVAVPRSPRRQLLDAFLDQGKRTVDLPDPSPERDAQLAAAVEDASVVLHDIHHQAADRDDRVFTGRRPMLRLSDTADSPAGATPTPELLLQAQAGWVYRRGPVDRPVRVGGRLADLAVGAFAAVGAVITLIAAEASGTNEVLDLRALECLYMTLPLSRFYRGPQTNALLDAGPPGILRCADGRVGINCLTGQHWEDFCALVGLPELSEHLPEIKASERAMADLRDRVQEWFLAQPAEEIVSLCQAMRIPAAPVGTGASVTGFAHWLARDSFTTMTVDGRQLACPRPPLRVSGPSDGGPAGGGRTGGMLGTPGRPFAGCRVLDLGSFWAAPYITCMMGALGADVVKIEGPRRPDGFRYFGVSPEAGEFWYETSAPWQATNLNKRGAAIDLTDPRGRELMLRLATDADVVIENFSPRVFDQFGIDHATLAQRNPAITLLRMPAYGLDGPWRDYVGWAATFEEIAGLAEVTGFPEGPPNIPGGQSDPVAGLHAAAALFAAIRLARRTGVGRSVEVATSDVMLYLSAEQILESAMTGAATTRQGNSGPDLAVETVDCDPERGWVASVEDRGGEVSTRLVAPQTLPHQESLAATEMTMSFDVAGAPEGRTFLNWPMRLRGQRVRQVSGPPRLGQHTAEVLAELGLVEEQIRELHGDGVVLAPDPAKAVAFGGP